MDLLLVKKGGASAVTEGHVAPRIIFKKRWLVINAFANVDDKLFLGSAAPWLGQPGHRHWLPLLLAVGINRSDSGIIIVTHSSRH